MLRKFDMKQFKVVEQKEHLSSTVVRIEVSRGDLYLLMADREGNVVLLDQRLDVLEKFEIEPQEKPCIGFNNKSLCFYLTTKHT